MSLQQRIMDELEKIAFAESPKITVSQKLTALRLLARYIGMDKGVKSEGDRAPAIIDDITEPALSGLLCAEPFNGEPSNAEPLNREQRRALRRHNRE